MCYYSTANNTPLSLLSKLSLPAQGLVSCGGSAYRRKHPLNTFQSHFNNFFKIKNTNVYDFSSLLLCRLFILRLRVIFYLIIKLISYYVNAFVLQSNSCKLNKCNILNSYHTTTNESPLMLRGKNGYRRDSSAPREVCPQLEVWFINTAVLPKL